MITLAQIEQFNRDGILILDSFLDEGTVSLLRNRYEPLFRGEFDTGLYPDEWNWREGRDDPAFSRQICNGWKCDRTIAGTVLSTAVGEACAKLGGWRGARIAQDNVIWKPKGAKSLGFHQDDSYILWADPPGYITCWIALDETRADGGTVEYARGSHNWGLTDMQPEYFHAPEDYRATVRIAAAHAGAELDIVSVEVPAGGCAFHHGRTWHGSGANTETAHRRALVTHCISSQCRFHPSNINYIYSRYKQAGSLDMSETFFPITWTETGYRSPMIEAFVAGKAQFPGADSQ